MEYDFYTENPKKPYPYKARYRPYQYREMTPEYLDVLRHRVRFTQTDCARLLAFVNQLLLEMKGEKSEWVSSGVIGAGKFDQRLKYRVKHRNGKYKYGKNLPKRLYRRTAGVREKGRKVATPEVLGY